MREESQLERILHVYECKKDRLRLKIIRLEKELESKKDIVKKFKTYAKEYANKSDSLSMKDVEMIKNIEAFYQNVCQVIAVEEKSLLKLEDTKKSLLNEVNRLGQKIEGLNKFLTERQLKEVQSLTRDENIEMEALYLTYSHFRGKL